MAYQFIHIETYSEAPKKVKGTEDHYNSVAQVMGEAMRLPAYSKHVDEPGKVWRLGGTMSVEELQAKRASLLVDLKETVRRKNGTTYQRKLRKDAATLYTEIHSHPLPAEDYLNAPDRHHPGIEKWCNLAMSDFKSRMPAGIDWSAVMHLDEGFVHFHILAINTPDPRLDANKLHAGKAAAARLRAELDQPTALVSLPKPKLEKRPNKPKQPRPSKNRETQRKNKIKREAQLAVWEKDCLEVEARNAALMKEWEAKNSAYLKAARKQRGAIPEKEAYTAAMKTLQDRYYEQVGRLCGLLRDGPRKERLSTVQYGKRKQSARKLENDLDQAATARDQAEETADHALDIKEEYQLRAKALAAEKAEFDEGVAAMEELADQLNEGSANLDGDQIEMINPPAFLKRLFGSRSPETKTTSLFRKLVTAIGRIAQTGSPAEELEK